MNLLITGAWEAAKEYFAELEQQGHNIVFMQYEKEKLPCEYGWVQGVVCNGLFITHPIENFVNLQYIQLTSTGYDRVPMQYIKDYGIEIRNAKGVYSIPMAEFCVGGVLSLYKKFSLFEDMKKQHAWVKNRELLELYQKKVCIVGCGNMGSECAKRFQAFGCDVTGVTPHPGKRDYFGQIFGMEYLNQILENSEIVVISIALSEQTINLFDENRMKKMKNGAVLVNLSRGQIVNEQALLRHIKRFTGALLDVFEEEPLHRESPLWDCENVVITPHISYVGDNNSKRISRVIIENLMSIKDFTPKRKNYVIKKSEE